MSRRSAMAATFLFFCSVRFLPPLAKILMNSEEKFGDELNSVQSTSVDIGGYFMPDVERTEAHVFPGQRAHHGAQTRILYRHPREPTGSQIRRTTCSWVVLG